MELILPIQSDRVRYTLIHKDWGGKIVDEPEGWNQDGIEFSRNDTYDGIVVSMTNSLVFAGDGADFISDVRAVYGVNTETLCLREERDPVTDVWTNSYVGFIDLTTYTKERNKVSVKLSLSSLEEVIKNRQGTDTEIERDESMDGETLPNILQQLAITYLDSREILLLSKLFAPKDTTNTPIQDVNMTVTGQQFYAVPELLAEPNSDQEYLQSVHEGLHTVNGFPQLSIFFDDNQTPTDEQLFYFNNDRPKQLKINVKYKFNYQWMSTAAAGSISAEIVKYRYNTTTQELDFIEVISNVGVHFNGVSATGNVDAEYSNFGINSAPVLAELEEHDCLAFRITLPRFAESGTVATRRLNIDYINLKVIQDSVFPTSITNSILSHQLVERLLNIIAGNDVNFYSEALGLKSLGYLEDGVDSGAYTAFAHGMWLRQFAKDRSQGRGYDSEIDNEEDEDNRYKPFTTSLQKVLKFFDATWGLTLGIERDFFRERIVVEPISYFYNLNTTISLGKVSNIKRSEAPDRYFSEIMVGYDKPEGDRLYEEAMGLDEYNVKSNFTTIIKVVDNIFEKVSPIRTDGYGIEFARRKPFINYPTEDTSYDMDVFALDVKPGRLINRRQAYDLRVWQDDFDEQPEGVYSPNTAHNLRFSPMNMLKRNSQYLTGLEKYAEGKIRFSSSEGNAGLETFKDGVTLKENGDLLNADLDRPIIIPEEISFEKSITFDINKQLMSSTIIGDKEVRNFYGCVEFINEFDEYEYGFIISVNPQEQGSWKLIKANR